MNAQETDTELHIEIEKKDRDGAHLVSKVLGETPLACIERFKKENPEYVGQPMTYAGRLDPMAEGLMILLSGDALATKDAFLGLDKTYVCEMLWGVETDTHDILGLVNTDAVSNSFPTVQNVESALEKSVGTFMQAYPAYSSKPVWGKPLFQWARERKLSEIEIPRHEVTLYEAAFVSRRSMTGREILADISRKISLVKGDFRQIETLDIWRLALTPHFDTEFVLDTISLTVSSGFYVRQYVADLAQTLGIPVTTFSIRRTRVGGYTL